MPEIGRGEVGIVSSGTSIDRLRRRLIETKSWKEAEAESRQRVERMMSMLPAGGPDDLRQLVGLGSMIDERLPILGMSQVGHFLAERWLKIRTKDGGLRRFSLNRAQLQYERDRSQRNIVLKARQMGISTWIAARFFLKTISQPGTMTVQVAHNQKTAEELFRIVHRFYGNLPERLRLGVLRASAASSFRLRFEHLDSEYRVESAADGNAGRGLTIQNLHCSEVSHWPRDAKAIMAGLKAALAPSGELVLESTASGAYGCFYDEWMGAERPESGLIRHFFPWWWEESFSSFGVDAENQSAEERELSMRNGLSPEQIGFRRTLRRQFGKLAQQEYAEDPSSCFLASGECLFDVAAIDRRLSNLPDVIETRLGGNVQIWLPPAAGRSYILAVDPAAGGVDGDYCAIEVIERDRGIQCAEVLGRWNEAELAAISVSMAREYNEALLVVERNNHGSGVLAHIGAGSGYERTYREKGLAGWLTNSASRPRMIALLGKMLDEVPEVFSSRRFLEQCRTFIRSPDGRGQGANGCHDDCVLAMAMALAVRSDTSGAGDNRSKTEYNSGVGSSFWPS